MNRNKARFSLALGLVFVTGICFAHIRMIPHQVKSVVNIGHVGTEESHVLNGIAVSYPYVYCAGEPGLSVVDVSDPSHPQLVSDQGTGSAKCYNPSIGRGHLFLPDWHVPLQAYSLGVPRNPQWTWENVRSSSHYHGWRSHVYENYLYTFESTHDENARIWVYDISYPRTPSELTVMHVPSRNCGGLLRVDDTLYFTNDKFLCCANVGNPTRMTLGASKPLHAFGGPIARQGDYLYVSARDPGHEGDDGGLHIFNIANRMNPVKVKYWTENFCYDPRDVYVVDNMAFMPTSGDELFTVDVSDPQNPYRIAWTAIKDFPICLNGYGKYLYVGSWEDPRFDPNNWGAKLSIVQVFRELATPTPTRTPTPTPTSSVRKGDMEPDGDVDLFDALRMVDILLGRPPDPTAHELTAGDMDSDGDIDLFDVLAVVDILLQGP